MANEGAASGGKARNLLSALLATAILTWAILTIFMAAWLSPWDFIVFWGAGRALNAGVDPYQVSVARAAGGLVPFFSPIVVAELFRPIAALVPSVMEAKVIWTALNLLAGGALSVILVHLSGLRVTARSVILAMTLLVAFEPFTSAMQLGQTDILVVLAVATSWLLIERQRYFLAGLIFCLGASNPHLILGIGVYYLYRALFRRELRLLLGMCAGAAILLMGCAVYPAYTAEWITRVLPATQAAGAVSPFQITLLRLTVAYGARAGLPVAQGMRLGGLVTAACAALSLIAAFMVWRRHNGRSMAIEMSAAIVLTVIATTYAYHQDFTLLTLLAPSIVVVWRDTRSTRKVGYLIACGSTLLFSTLPGFIGFSALVSQRSLYFGWSFLTGALMLAQMSANRALLRQAAPWVAVLVALALVGDFLPNLDLSAARLLQGTLIMVGQLAYLFAIWRWYGSESAGSGGRLHERDAAGARVGAQCGAPTEPSPVGRI